MSVLDQFVVDRHRSFLESDQIADKVFVCDMDSIITALSYAFIYDRHQGKELIPCINTNTLKVLEMRGEITLILAENAIDKTKLIRVDEVFDKSSQHNSIPSFFLVDHNEISGKWQRKFGNLPFNVAGILDHHADAGLFLDVTPRAIQVCGSTASLLVGKIMNEADGISIEKLKNIAKPLLTTIIFDTINLTWRQNPLDIRAAEILCNLLGPSSGIEGRSLLAELDKAINSTPESGFGIYDLLSKDYKVYAHHDHFYGISTIHTPFSSMIGSDFPSLDRWSNEVRRFMQTEDLQLLLMTIAVREPGESAYYQQLAIFAREPDMVPKLSKVLQAKNTQLSLIQSGDDFALYNQCNINISRKQLHPFAKEFMAQHYPS